MIAGVGTAGAVAVSDTAWERFKDVTGDALPRQTVRNIVFGTLGLHAAEASLAYVSARRNGVDSPGRWARSTLLWGFPVLRRLRKTRKAEAALSA